MSQETEQVFKGWFVDFVQPIAFHCGEISFLTLIVAYALIINRAYLTKNPIGISLSSQWIFFISFLLQGIYLLGEDKTSYKGVEMMIVGFVGFCAVLVLINYYEREHVERDSCSKPQIVFLVSAIMLITWYTCGTYDYTLYAFGLILEAYAIIPQFYYNHQIGGIVIIEDDKTHLPKICIPNPPALEQYDHVFTYALVMFFYKDMHLLSQFNNSRRMLELVTGTVEIVFLLFMLVQLVSFKSGKRPSSPSIRDRLENYLNKTQANSNAKSE